MIEPFKHIHQKYEINGITYPSVTTILGVINKPFLVPWANKLGREGINSTEYTKRIADIGTLTHALIQGHLEGEEVSLEGYPEDYKEEAKKGYNSYLLWESQHQVKPILSEESFISEDLGFAGTIDALMEIDGKLTLVDFKTSSAIHPEYLCQLSAYLELYKEKYKTEEKIPAMILKVNKEDKPSFETAYLTDRMKYLSLFYAAFSLYKAQQEASKLKLEINKGESR